MAAFEVIALDTATPQLRAPGASDTYTFPRAVEMPLGTANGVLYLNGSKVVTSGSALTFDGTYLGVVGDITVRTGIGYQNATNNSTSVIKNSGSTGVGNLQFDVAGSEQMRLTSTGLGIGTSSPAYKLDVQGSAGVGAQIYETSTGTNKRLRITQETAYVKYDATYSSAGNLHSWWVGGTRFMDLDTSGNLGLGVTPSAWVSNRRVLEIGGGAAALALNGSAAVSEVFANAIRDAGGAYRYFANGPASYVDFNNSSAGGWSWAIASSGTAGNVISFTQALTLDVNRNLALNTTSVGTSAVGALSIGSGTEPSSGPADTVQLYSVDRSAGNTIPAFYCEGTGVTNAGITNTTVTHKIAMKINGTVYYLLATTNAT